MNTQGNARSRATKEKIYKAFMYLLRHKTFSEIYVKDICTIACINRSSFYEHYRDINDFMIETEGELSRQMHAIFSGSPYYSKENFIKMFEFIKANKEFYGAYLKNNDGSFMAKSDFDAYKKNVKSSTESLYYSEREIVYHLAFFGAGLNAVCKVWLNTDMKETPEQMAEIIYKEYSEKLKHFQN